MSNEQDKPEIQEPKPDNELGEEVLEQAGENDEAPESEAAPEVVEQPELTVEELQKQLAAAEKKAAENWEKMVRMQAEMENLKRRTRIDLENAHKFALEKFAKELLTVMDSLELGIQAANGDSPEVVKLREGSELTLKQFEAVFAKFNIEVIDPVGQPFDPEKHQAMSMMPSADAEPNTVLNVLQKGYLLNGRLIRPAMVVVSKAEDKPSGETKIDEQA
ncbi:nucleotide exchange factor GrpE [Methylomarinum vadi]|uniref:nucleotide exchange factor GrpE n=1 Tax=Methylomarinum vadi TaxID=438855 RepID=UPI0004DF456B|nr:nucleotide exchange factor GrpE [Methylomarinum vadi]